MKIFELFNVVFFCLSLEFKYNKWKDQAITVAGGNEEGQEIYQLSNPQGIFIADFNNHQILEWKCNAPFGNIIAGGNGRGSQIDQLCCPTDIIVDKENHSFIIADFNNQRVIRWFDRKQQILIHDIKCCSIAMYKYGFLYVSNCSKNEVRQWKLGGKVGKMVAGGIGQGNKLNQLNFPTFIFVDDEQSIYISDRDNHRLIKWRKNAKQGVIVAGGNGEGNDLNQLSSPEGLFVNQWNEVFVADYGNDRIMVWCEDNTEGLIIAEGNESNQLNGPTGLSFDSDGHLYVADYKNHRIQKYETLLD
ncbi:hypothetical protein I4U23_005979 [Adineta vaga]|nr:hypothetical protein I4U23_005979 [Adineta vaga]